MKRRPRGARNAWDFLLILTSFDDFEARFLTNVVIFGCSVVFYSGIQPNRVSTVFVSIFYVKRIEILTIFSTKFQIILLFIRGSCSAPDELYFSSCSAPKLLFGACSVSKQKGVEGLNEQNPGAAHANCQGGQQCRKSQHWH